MLDAIHKIQSLGDLGLACALCLISGQHGIVLASSDGLDEVASIVAARCSQDLGLSTVVIECSQGTDLEHFRQSILIQAPSEADDLSYPLDKAHHGRPEISLDEHQVANVVVAKNLNMADIHVQIQALELIRSGRMYTRTAMHTTSSMFVLIALIEYDSPYTMNPHLNEMFAIAHHHQLAEDLGSDASSVRSRFSTGANSMHSVLLKRPSFSRSTSSAQSTQLGPETLVELHEKVPTVTMTAEMSQYLQNVVVTLRLHRFVAKGISAVATRHLRTIAKALAILHGLDYVTPAIVDLAVRKVYLHRLVLANDKTERSLRWGSNPAAVRENLQGVTVESAIDTILSAVQAPI